MISCPKCGYENPDNAQNCSNCGVNLQFAIAHPEAFVEEPESAVEDTTPKAVVAQLRRADPSGIIPANLASCVARQLLDGEPIEQVASAVYSGKRLILVATNGRLLLFDTTATILQAISYDEITSIGYKSGLFGTIEIMAGQRMTFGYVVGADKGASFCRYINGYVAKGQVTCPKCGSTSLNASQRGVGAGKALVGAVVVGPVGLLAGLSGKGDIVITCLNCGHRWKAGKR